MKSWNEIKQEILNKLFMDETEAEQLDYIKKFNYIANECLVLIANSVKPKIRSFKFNVYKHFVEGTDFVLDDGFIHYTTKSGRETDILPDDNTLYYESDEKKYVYKNNSLVLTGNAYVRGQKIIMPDDFITFANLVNYRNNEEFDELVYLDQNSFYVRKTGSYEVFYNGLWDKIPTEDATTNFQLDIDTSVLNCVPSYVASQLVAQDDTYRSAMLANDFERMLARLDTDDMIETKHFRSEGGWY